MKVGFDPSTSQVDEQRTHEHLGGGDRVARRGATGSNESEQRREQTDDAAEDERSPDMQMRAADGAVPGQGRYPECECHAGHPLKNHQAGEQPVGVLVDVLLVSLEQLAGSGSDRLR